MVRVIGFRDAVDLKPAAITLSETGGAAGEGDGGGESCCESGGKGEERSGRWHTKGSLKEVQRRCRMVDEEGRVLDLKLKPRGI